MTAAAFDRRVALATGVAFVVAALPKFAAFGWERDNFERFGLPAPGAWVIVAGVIELLGGLALIKDRGAVLAIALLTATMCVAIVASGVLQGDVVPSLTAAPLLLTALVFLFVRRRRAPPATTRRGE